MQYRKFEKLGFECSAFGVGCMRLPVHANPDGTRNYENINEEEAIQMIRHAIDHGVNYIDTAYGYHGGNSERLVGKALQDGYREKVKLATKLPVWLAKSYEDFDRLLNEQLTKLQTDHVDFYLLHALHKESWEKVRDMGVLGFLDKAVEDGRIKHPGFSFHDELPVFKDIIDSYDWKMCQIQLNILDEHNQAGVEGLKYAGSKGIPVVVMEPLRGGKLASVSKDIEDIWNEAETKRNPAEWAFRWLYNFPEVAVILSGISTMEQADDNLRIFDSAAPNCMSEQELSLVKKVKAAYDRKIKVGCTGCEYCMPCPNGVSIPEVFSLYNESSIFGEIENYQKRYSKMVMDDKDASKCIECGNCESVCPQHIEIIEKLKEASAALTK
jgi:predicted aldo/keto reductase-like oxidoreductase